MRWQYTVFALILVALSGGLSMNLHAHDARPVYVEINERSGGVFQVQWKVPVSVPPPAHPGVEMPAHCEPLEEPTVSRQGDALFYQRHFSCPQGISASPLALVYPGSNPSLSALFQVNLENGERHTQVLRPGRQSWTVPEAENFWNVAGQYTILGVEHIFLGMDHLLFVACLVFIAGTFRRILITITGFTLAHSLTLALSTLGVVQLPIAPVEAAIALSIAFLAHEIAVGRRDKSWTWRYPVVVSTSFGLLHGFGFASVLQELGLPQTELVSGLLFFNVGVEIGQIAFVLILAGIALLLASALKQRVAALLEHRRLNLAGSYLIGIVAVYWLIERTAGF